MKAYTYVLAMLILSVISCSEKSSALSDVEGTWKLVTGTLIEKGDTTLTDYTGNVEMIKVINKTHFAFLNHDIHHGKDSTASFAAGGGKYTLTGDEYVEHLDYCSDRQWEGHEFKFRVKVSNDTLVQTGSEVVENLGVNRLNIERYVRVKEQH